MANKEKKETKEGKGGLLTDMARKLLLTGIGAIFMTEESIRSTLGDLKLPKDAMGYVVDQAKKQKDDMMAVLASEFSNFFSKINVHEEIVKALSRLQIHIDAKFSFTPKGKATSHEVNVNVREKDQ